MGIPKTSNLCNEVFFLYKFIGQNKFIPHLKTLNQIRRPKTRWTWLVALVSLQESTIDGNSIRISKLISLGRYFQYQAPLSTIFSADYCPQRSCGKVMFLHLSVILFIGGYLADTLLGRPPGVDTPSQKMASAADGTRPTGMHSCLNYHFTALLF